MSLKLGKHPATVDIRTIKLEYILNVAQLPPIPDSYDEDVALGVNFVESNFGNDNWGDCVIAYRANQELRFEYAEQKTQIPITTQDCLTEYWREQGYVQQPEPKCWLSRLFYNPPPQPDDGLNMLKSAAEWKNYGWILGGKFYNIYAFAGISVGDNPQLDLMLKQGVYLLSGVGGGIQVPQSAIDQFKNGQMWDVTDPIDLHILGGHAVYVKGYNEIGPVCITWGKEQQMTWAFWHEYADESIAAIDQRDPWVENSPIDVELLDEYLAQIAAGQ